MRATIKEVAARAGVSIKTVSNVVHGRDTNYRESTRQQVLAAIKELNYRPNMAARHLRTAHAGVLALAIPDLTNPYFGDLASAVVSAATALGYSVLLDQTNGERAKEVVVARGMRPHLIDGVLLDALALEASDLRSTDAAIPIVLIGERLFDATYDHVAIDNAAAARAATAHLAGLGRRRIAAIGMKADSAPSLRFRGFLSALADAGLPADPQLIIPTRHFYRADGAAAMRDLLTRDEPPDAVFCFNDVVALGAMRALHDAGRRIPDDVAVVGFDDTADGRYNVPSLTSISPDKEYLARLAVSLLIERIDGRRTGAPERFEPSFHLVVRESTAGTR